MTCIILGAHWNEFIVVLAFQGCSNLKAKTKQQKMLCNNNNLSEDNHDNYLPFNPGNFTAS
jgi:hypothetical protein